MKPKFHKCWTKVKIFLLSSWVENNFTREPKIVGIIKNGLVDHLPKRKLLMEGALKKHVIHLPSVKRVTELPNHKSE